MKHAFCNHEAPSAKEASLFILLRKNQTLRRSLNLFWYQAARAKRVSRLLIVIGAKISVGLCSVDLLDVQTSS